MRAFPTILTISWRKNIWAGDRRCGFPWRRCARCGEKIYDSLELVKRLVNIGDAKSLACHPADHDCQMSPQELEKAGVTVEMIRLSIGIEHVEDIIDDLDRARWGCDRAFLQDPFHANSARRGLALRFKPRLEAASPFYDAPLRAARAATPRPQRQPIEIAFVNNMPDLAASATVYNSCALFVRRWATRRSISVAICRPPGGPKRRDEAPAPSNA